MSDINIAQGSLVMIGLNTSAPQVLWNGMTVDGITGINVVNNSATQSVVLKLAESEQIASMQAAGITIRREV
jgi:hypothetical protein